jgi:adenosylcobinamide-phosphate synthase
VTGPALALASLLIESVSGYPDRLFRLIRHPVVWLGALIAVADRGLNRPAWPDAARRAGGLLALASLLVAAALPASLLQALLAPSLPGFIVLALLAASLSAGRNLHDHVRAVGDALARDGLAGGRAAVSRIVGRDPDSLDEAGVLRAAIESLAENFSDGVTAPALWCVLLGLPGMAAYKAVNTADSMIGHRTPRHAAFGWAAARLDDLLNLPASRLAALWLILACILTRGADARGAWRAVRRDARHHRSPNAGWPEAAMAGALGLALAGPRIYGAARVADAWMGDGRAAATPGDLARALRLYRRACALQIFAVAMLVLALRWLALR